jgi:hypothetical protein
MLFLSLSHRRGKINLLNITPMVASNKIPNLTEIFSELLRMYLKALRNVFWKITTLPCEQPGSVDFECFTENCFLNIELEEFSH